LGGKDAPSEVLSNTTSQAAMRYAPNVYRGKMCAPPFVVRVITSGVITGVRKISKIAPYELFAFQ